MAVETGMGPADLAKNEKAATAGRSACSETSAPNPQSDSTEPNNPSDKCGTPPGFAAAPAGPHTSPETNSLANRRPLKSGQLDRTLAELENAFAAWDSITEEQGGVPKPKTAIPNITPTNTSAPSTTPDENEFRSKTRRLLHQLRDQLADLSED